MDKVLTPQLLIIRGTYDSKEGLRKYKGGYYISNQEENSEVFVALQFYGGPTSFRGVVIPEGDVLRWDTNEVLPGDDFQASHDFPAKYREVEVAVPTQLVFPSMEKKYEASTISLKYVPLIIDAELNENTWIIGRSPAKKELQECGDEKYKWWTGKFLTWYGAAYGLDDFEIRSVGGIDKANWYCGHDDEVIIPAPEAWRLLPKPPLIITSDEKKVLANLWDVSNQAEGLAQVEAKSKAALAATPPNLGQRCKDIERYFRNSQKYTEASQLKKAEYAEYLDFVWDAYIDLEKLYGNVFDLKDVFEVLNKPLENEDTMIFVMRFEEKIERVGDAPVREKAKIILQDLYRKMVARENHEF